MILVDTSVWIDHLRHGERALAELLDRAAVLMHPFVVGELACGHLTDRTTVLNLLRRLPSAAVADGDEVLTCIENHRLHGLGIGYVDAHFLASVLLSGDARLWTRDKRLQAAAATMGLAASDPAAH